MKVLHVTTAVSKQSAANRINKALQQINVDSKIYVETSNIQSADIIKVNSKSIQKIEITKNRLLDNFKLRKFGQLDYPVTLGSGRNKSLEVYLNNSEYDIVNLHWIGSGFLPIKSLGKIKKRIVWTLHDSWAFTGGCHIPFDCKSYSENCKGCPQLNNKSQTITESIIELKSKAYKSLDLTFVTPSKWLAETAKKSFLLKDMRIEVIPNCIDTNVFKPLDKSYARTILNLPIDKKIIGFGAVNSTKDKNKGFEYLETAIRKLADKREDIELVIFGAESGSNEQIKNIKYNFMGRVYDDITLAVMYSALDVFVVPSLSENLPNTIMEAQSCGIPVAAFNVGGIPEMITHRANGYLAEYKSIEDLSEAITWCLDNNSGAVSENARKHVLNNYSYDTIAKKYYSLYKSI